MGTRFRARQYAAHARRAIAAFCVVGFLALSAIFVANAVSHEGDEYRYRDCPSRRNVSLDEVEARAEPLHAWLRDARDEEGIFLSEVPPELLERLRMDEVEAEYRRLDDGREYSIRVGNYADCLWEYDFYSSSGLWRLDV